jgi:hypothetical protein
LPLNLLMKISFVVFRHSAVPNRSLVPAGVRPSSDVPFLQAD